MQRRRVLLGSVHFVDRDQPIPPYRLHTFADV
jgi:hypothetical protein